MSVIWKDDDATDHIACCIVVGRRVSQKAVARNRLKRLLRAAFLEERSRFLAGQGAHVVAIANQLPVALNLKTVREELRACLEKLRVISRA